MMNILVMESLPKVLDAFVWSSRKFREATALRGKVRREEKGDPMVTVAFQVIEKGAKPTLAKLSRSQVEVVLNQQPLKDGVANWEEMERVAGVMHALRME
jgi:hypothetical protein